MALETSAGIQVVVMDKTGTLTMGEPEVTEVIADGIEEDELLRLVSAVERESEHPWPKRSASLAPGMRREGNRRASSRRASHGSTSGGGPCR